MVLGFFLASVFKRPDASFFFRAAAAAHDAAGQVGLLDADAGGGHRVDEEEGQIFHLSDPSPGGRFPLWVDLALFNRPSAFAHLESLDAPLSAKGPQQKMGKAAKGAALQ